LKENIKMYEKFIRIAQAVLVVILVSVIVASFITMKPVQTDSNTFNWDKYEDAIESGNPARIKKNFTGRYYITGKVTKYLSTITDSVVIVRPDNTEDSIDMIVNVSEDDVSKIDIGDIITVYQKTEVFCGDIMGVSGELISIDSKAKDNQASYISDEKG